MGKAEKTYHGLQNQGATCYLNSVLQVLFMTEDFRENVKRNNARKEHIDQELRQLFTDLEKYESCTYKITTKLKIRNVHEQRDAAEHYEKILRLTSPEASQIFHGELINRTICQHCKDKTESLAGFWHLPLPLVNNNNEYSVDEGIKDFFRLSEISGDNQMYCETCDEKRDAVLDSVVKCHPEVLVLLLKRFEFDYRTMTYVKINQPVNVANALQLSGNQYELYAIVEHFGELRFGHYISTIKSQDDGKWYIFNDTKVTPHQASPALERSQSAYLLFYQKQKVTPPVNTTNGAEDICKTTEENQVPEKSKQENKETTVRPALKRPGSTDETIREEGEVKKPKQELTQRGLTCKDLDTGSSSSSQQMCEPYVASLNKETMTYSECKVDNSNMNTEFSDHEQHGLTQDEHLKNEQEAQSEMKERLQSGKTDQFEIKDQEQSETERYCTGDLMKTMSETPMNTWEGRNDGNEERFVNEFDRGFNQKTQFIQNWERPDDSGAETATAKDGKEGESETRAGVEFNPSSQYGFDHENSTQASMTEGQNSGQRSERHEGCSFTSQTGQRFCDDNKACEGPQSCPDVYVAIEKQGQGSDQAERMCRNNEGTIEDHNRCFSADDGSGQQTHDNDEKKNNVLNEIIDQIDNSTEDAESRELSMKNALVSEVDEKGNSSSEKEMESSERSCKNDYEKIQTEGLYQERSSCTESDVPMQKCHSKERLIEMEGIIVEESAERWDLDITAAYKDTDLVNRHDTLTKVSETKVEVDDENDQKMKSKNLGRTEKGGGGSVEGDQEKAGSELEDAVGGDIVQNDYMDINAACKETDPGESTSVDQKQSFSTVQEDEVEVQIEKSDEKINLEKLEITENSDICVEGQAGSNTNALVKSRPGSIIYEKLYLPSLENRLYSTKSQSDKWDREKHKQPTTFPTKRCISEENKDRFRQENVVDTSCSTPTFEKKEMAGNLKEQVTFSGKEFAHVDKITEGDEEIFKITLKKKTK